MTAEDSYQKFFISPGLLSQAVDEMKAWEQKLLKDIRSAEEGSAEPGSDDLVWIAGPNLITEQGRGEYIFENVLFASLTSAAHKLERILKDIASKEASRYLMLGKIIRLDEASSKEISHIFRALGSPLGQFPSFGTVETLQDVVNMFKHGVGRASKKLYEEKPELFEKDIILPSEKTRKRLVVVLAGNQERASDREEFQISFQTTGDPTSFRMNSKEVMVLISSTTALLSEMKMAAQGAAISQIVR